MRRLSDPKAILTRLLERHERSSGARRIVERPTQEFDSPAELQTLLEFLREAESAGAVELGWDRDVPHLVEHVTLLDAERLYVFTGRTLPTDLLRDAVSRIEAVETRTEGARTLARDLVAAWSEGRRLASLGVGQVEDAITLLRAADAVFTELPHDVPLRTRSVRLLGDSKALERALPALFGYFRQAGLVAPNSTREEILEEFGLGKFRLPVLVGGPVLVEGSNLAAWPYVGLPPDVVSGIELEGPVRSVLTIENLESFNRHVRTCRESGDVVVYSGGFPSSAVLGLLRRILGIASVPLHHWGDIDPGGIRIGRHLETSLGTQVVPHLMQVELARQQGTKPNARQTVPIFQDESAFGTLSAFLRSGEAKWLEQEVVDPRPTIPCTLS